MFVTRDITVADAWVVTDQPGETSPSDHRPVVADILVKPQAGWRQR